MGGFAFDVAPVMELVSRELSSELPPIPDQIRSSVLRSVADRVMAGIISRWPVDTGLSLAGFHVLPIGDSWQVRNPVDYTTHVHDGLVDDVAAHELSQSIDFARDLTRQLMSRQAGKPGTRQRQSIEALRKRSRLPASALEGAADALRASGAAPEPVIALYEAGDINGALSLMRTLLQASTISRAAQVSTAESLARTGQISSAIVALVRAGQLERAITRLVRNGLAAEAQAIARGRR